jgi:pyruvate dehydrogenase E1 component beta subunit
MRELSMREALGEAMAEEMERDDRVFLMGEEVGEYDGAYKVSKGLLARFGEMRVVDSPISEAGFAGLGVGAALAGLRPIIEMMTFNFSILAFDMFINHAAKWRYMSGGQFTVPIVFRGPGGAAHMLGAQHSQVLDSMLAHVPGLKVVSVATPYDAKGLLKSAIRDDNPVIFIESELMYADMGPVPADDYTIPLGQGDIKRPGRDVTLIGWNKTLHTAMAAAKALSEQGIDAEVIDPRTLRPLDMPMILSSVKKTSRLVVVQEGWPYAGVAAEIAMRVQEEAFDYLDAPVLRVTNLDAPMPYNEKLEEHVLPSVERVVDAARKVCYAR